MAPKPQRDELPSLNQVTNSKSETGDSKECFMPLALKATAAGSGGKTSSNGKIFSEDDVVCLLKRLADFWADGKSNKWAEFHLFVKDDLSKEYTRRQVSEKIRSLNDKFHNARVKPSNPHDSTVYELSKALWEDELDDQRKRKPKKKKRRKSTTNETILAIRGEDDQANTILATDESYKKLKQRGEEEEIGLDEFESEYPYLCASFKMPGCPVLSIKECASIGRKSAQELEYEWRELKAQQLRFELKKLNQPRAS